LFSGAVLAKCVLITLLGCQGGEVGSRNRVAELEAGYFYRTSEMMTPRYEHQAVTLDDGTAFIVSGTDERCFSSIDSCELFDQRILVEPEPASKSGGWIDTDFEGEDLRLEGGGRVFHTVTRATEGNVIVIGGAPDGVLGEAYPHPELYSRHTRKFQVLSATLGAPRFHHTAVAVTEGEIYLFGGQVSMKATIVDPQYPPNDPRFIREINTFPSTNSIEIYDASLPSDDGKGDFTPLKGGDKAVVKLPGNYGRGLHATVRLAGSDNILGNAGDVYLCVAGIQTLSPINAPVMKLRRTQQGQSQLQRTIDVYDGAAKTCFIAPGTFLEAPCAHGVNADNLGWHSNRTYDGYLGQSNTFLISGGSDDSLPTTGRYLSEGFAATFSGLGPGGGISLLGLSPPNTTVGDIAAALNLTTDFADVDVRYGKYFASETAADTGVINRVHTNTVKVLRRVYTDYGQQSLGMLFTGAGGFFYVVMGAQIEVYDGSPVAAGEYFDPNFSVINGLFNPQSTPYDLMTLRKYWHIKNGVALPSPNSPGVHPNPSGIDGSWLITDGYVPGDGFEGYQPLSDTLNDDDRIVRFMERGRAWHTVSPLPGMDGVMDNEDDRMLFAGGGDSVLTYGGMPVVPSAVIYVPPATR
jgi:hypothetical protein